MAIENEQDANLEDQDTSEPGNVGNEEQSQESEEQTQEASQGTEEQEPQKTADETIPFHEHPRWKELMNERDQYKQAIDQLREQMDSAKQPQGEQPKSLIERINESDPEFGKSYQELQDLRDTVATLQASQQKQLSESLDTKLSSLAKEHEIPEFLQSRIKNDLDALANKESGRFDTWDKLSTEYATKAKEYKTFLEGVKRETTKSYSESKKENASRPRTQTKGRPSAHSKAKPKFSDPEEMLASIAKEAVAGNSDGDL